MSFQSPPHVEIERRVGGILDSIIDAVHVIDADWRIAYMNQQALRMHGAEGIDARTLIGRRLWDFLGARAGDDAIVRQLEQAMRERVPTVFEHRYPLNDRWYSSRIFPSQDGGLVGVSQDITERRRTEEALRESEARFRSMADSSPMMIWVTDREGRVEFVNRAYLEFFGLEQHQIPTFDWRAFLHPDDAPRYIALFQDGMAARAPVHARTRVRRADGAWRWIESRATPRLGTHGEMLGYTGCSPDITEIYESQEALREADRRKDEFLATLAHELRGPLAPLRNGLQIMKLAVSKDRTLEQARGMMERQLSMLTSLVDDLLDVSRISRGQIPINKQRVDIAAVVSSALETSEPLLRQGRHELNVVLPPERVYVNADKLRLAQAISNLLSNAAKYTELGGRITLTVLVEGDEVCVSVKDTGIGIPANMLTRVFEMFTQVDTSIRHAQGGLGIGLTIVKRLVEMHGGSISVHSDGPGHGSEFTIRLPMESVAAGEQPATERSAADGLAQHRILVVDDNKEAALSLALMLNLMGNDTRTAFDGLEAVKAAAAFHPEVILMDLGMPRLNGYEAARRIREADWAKDTVLVAVTGWGQEIDRRASMQAGFDYHLVKPAEPEQLQELLMSLSAAPHQHANL